MIANGILNVEPNVNSLAKQMQAPGKTVVAKYIFQFGLPA
jgi:hypothetical protein